MDTFTLTSDAFASDKLIPVRFTCEGGNVNPPLSVANTPDSTMSLAIVMEDPDIPDAVKEEMGIAVFDHWVAYNISPSTNEIDEDDSVGTQGKNSGGSVGYTGPCPPVEHEPTEHRYVFSVYALDTTLDLPEGATKSELENSMEGHIIATAELIGRYEKRTA